MSIKKPHFLVKRSVTDSRIALLLDKGGSWVCFFASLVTYLLTIAPSASYWDCPEYITSAMFLEPGHPPGNPFYMLAAHAFALLAPSPQTVALCVNILSALLSAFAVMLTFRCAWIIIDSILPTYDRYSRLRSVVTCLGSACAALSLAWSDTFWFSAVEAEVYAFSALGTTLSLWLMLLWLKTPDTRASDRLLILSAYIIGLMLGVHQLNLLCIPALAVIFMIKLSPPVKSWRIWLAIAISFLITGSILIGLIEGIPTLAAAAELFCVNTLHLPYHSGVIAFMLLFSALLIALIIVATRYWSRTVQCIVWMTAMLFLGFSSFAVMYIRGVANPPMNQGGIDSIFAMQSYLRRDQYGSTPLLYGRTPYSQIMRDEVLSTDSAGNITSATYTHAHADSGQPVIRRKPAPQHGYEIVRSISKYRYTPELDMWLPRITSSNPDDIKAYESWAGMDSTTMVWVDISQGVDSLGNSVAKWSVPDKKRVPGRAPKPTYLHNLQYLGSYQISYMYLRYLMWNFSGRQNDVHSQGQIDNGNFITGFPAIDNAMLGDQGSLPVELGSENPGRNVYFLLPFILGLVGIVWMVTRGREGRRLCAAVALLFFMTGIAIVLYLNQAPGEPRERDYSFVGSFFAFSLWIGIGAAGILSWFRKCRWCTLLTGVAVMGVPTLMLAQNYHDHDRSGITLTRDLAANLLNSVPEHGIIFVNGDNHTFPVWYITEVEKVRPDVGVVNTAYLSTDWYPSRLDVPIIADPGTFSDGRFGIVYLNRSNPDTLDAETELHRLYAETKRGTRPELSGTKFRYALANGDSAVIDLSTLMPGKHFMPQKELLFLDIVVAAAKEGRPVTWLQHFGPDKVLNLNSRTTCEGLVRVYRPHISHEDSIAADLRSYHLFVDTFQYGGLARHGLYVDPTSGRMVTDTRARMTALAHRLLDRGEIRKALQVLTTMERQLPAYSWPYKRVVLDGNIFMSGIEAGKMYVEIADIIGDPKLRAHGQHLIEEGNRIIEQYNKYYRQAPQRVRNVLSTRFRSTALMPQDSI